MIISGLLKSLNVTLKNFINNSTTVQYPNRYVGIFAASKYLNTNPVEFFRKHPKDALKALFLIYPIPERVNQNSHFRGNEFTWYEQRCTGCASCAKYCPLGIIEIVTHPGGFDTQQGESYTIDVFDIDIGRCMFCGLCVEACPYDALHMGSTFERAQYSREALLVTKEELNQNEKRPSTWFRPQLSNGQFNPYSDQLQDHKDVGRHEKPTADDLKDRWVDAR